jgi:NAD(P)-dependent dehydrogenase (short-subunit alcohol dehydrogenase family)
MRTPLAVVTGAASGIGLALTHELVGRSIDVIAIDKDPLSFARMPTVTTAQIDIRDLDAMQRLADTFSDRKLDYLFSNAGIGAAGTVFGATQQDWQCAWDINTMGSLNTLRCWWPHLKAARGKAVVTVSSAALLAYPGAALYRASKAALLSVLESVYYESRDSGISLHALCAGMVRSNIIANARKENPQAEPDALASYLEEAMRTAEPAEAFAKRVLDALEHSPPFYWLTHPETLAAIRTRHGAIIEGHPSLNFGEMR